MLHVFQGLQLHALDTFINLAYVPANLPVLFPLLAAALVVTEVEGLGGGGVVKAEQLLPS